MKPTSFSAETNQSAPNWRRIAIQVIAIYFIICGVAKFIDLILSRELSLPNIVLAILYLLAGVRLGQGKKFGHQLAIILAGVNIILYLLGLVNALVTRNFEVSYRLPGLEGASSEPLPFILFLSLLITFNGALLVFFWRSKTKDVFKE